MSNKISFVVRIFSFVLLLIGTSLTNCAAQKNKNLMVIPLFSENPKTIPLEERSRRKFDNAVIADLDQDGYLDLLLTEHSRRVEPFWNNKGTFVKGKPFIFGDTHGIAVGDYDFDGRIEILVQPGGGDGKNPRRISHYKVNPDRSIEEGGSFKHFEGSRGRAVKFIDVDNNGSLDLITSAFPSIKELTHGNALYKRDTYLGFKFVKYLPHGDRFGIRTTLTDFNQDNITDILFHGGQNIVAVKGENGVAFNDSTEEILDSLSKINLVNSISEIDFDNDGDFDLFLTRSKHPFDSESDYDEDKKIFYFFARRKAFNFDNLKIKGNLKIENLQMAFPHFDIFIGAKKRKWERKEDKHGHHDFSLTPEEAQGWPDSTTQKGLYIGYLGDDIWRIAGHTDSPTTAVIHNVLSKPKTIKLKELPAKLLENRDGKFVDVSEDYGIDIKEQTSSSAIGDFNNDGWADIFVVRYGSPAQETKQILYLNQEGKRFIRSESHGIVTKELGVTGMGADAFDYDKDGDLDIIYSNERGRWHLFTNNSQPGINNFIEVNIGNSPSHKATSVGAILTLNACGNIYKRVVGRTSSSYSHSNNTYLHIGLGQCNVIETAHVTWSNGETVELNIDGINKIYSAGSIRQKN
ncbi:CRTAC1 family protein [Aquimarina algiphila]|uniref:CRTAC1 family protein n=1 Tax=Aquimarina algiphila TaxID=2047982 RepID=UPI0023304260|nr:CRTAC1 family protein [Aquimarina algiphila]